MLKKLLIIISSVIFVIIFFIIFIGPTNKNLNSSVSSVTKLSTIDYSPETEGYGSLFLNENGDVCCYCSLDNYTDMGDFLTREGMFNFYNVYNVTDQEYLQYPKESSEALTELVPEISELSNVDYFYFDEQKDGSIILSFSKNIIYDSTIAKISNDNKLIYKFNSSDVPWPTDYYKLLFAGGHVMEREDGNLYFIYSYYHLAKGQIYTYAIVNPYTKEIIDIREINLLEGHNIWQLKDDQILVTKYENDMKIIYNLDTGEIVNQLPGNGPIYTFGGHIYTTDQSGIYRSESNSPEYECILNLSEIGDIEGSLNDLFIYSEKELYLTYKTSSFDGSYGTISYYRIGKR